MDKTDKVCHLLLSLHEDYDSVITATETINNIKVTMDFVKAGLLDEKLRIKEKSISKN